MNRALRILIACLASPALVSAARVPGHDTDPVNAGLFTRAGQTRLAAHLGQKFEGVHAFGGVAVAREWAVTGSVAYADLNHCLSCTISERRHLDAGIGWFRQDSATGWIREGIAGAGLGRFRMTGNPGKWDPQPEDMRVTAGWYEMAYLQAQMGKRFKWNDRIGALRLAAYRFTGFSLKDGNGAPKPIEAEHWGLYVEPAGIYRLGFPLVKADFQIGLSLPLLQAEGLDNNLIWATVGIGFDLFAK